MPQVVIIQDEGGNVFGGVSTQHWGQSEVARTASLFCLIQVLIVVLQLQLTKDNSNDGRRPWSIYRSRCSAQCGVSRVECHAPVDRSPGAFLFSIINPHGDPPCAFPLRNNNDPRAICEAKRQALALFLLLLH